MDPSRCAVLEGARDTATREEGTALNTPLREGPPRLAGVPFASYLPVT